MEELRLIFAFAVVFGLLALLYLFAGKSKAGSRVPFLNFGTRLASTLKPVTKVEAEPVTVSRRLNLTPTHQVHVLQMGNQKLLLCTFPGGCQLLSSAEISDPLPQCS